MEALAEIFGLEPEELMSVTATFVRKEDGKFRGIESRIIQVDPECVCSHENMECCPQWQLRTPMWADVATP